MGTESVRHEYSDLRTLSISRGNRLLFVLAIYISCSAGAAAEYDVPPQELANALREFSSQADAQIIFTSESVRDRISTPIKGAYDLERALDILLRDTGLTHSVDENGVIIIAPAPEQSWSTYAGERLVAQNDTLPHAGLGHRAADAAEARDVTTGRPVVEEVVVTAQKRGAQSVQDVPGGISAFSGATLDDYNFRSLDDFRRLEPALQIPSQGLGDSQLVIRGIQSAGSGTVGLYFDETVMTSSNFQDGGGRTADIRLYDVNRIEVLKGPQGTLFGASSMSGTVRIMTNQPNPSGFDAAASVGGYATEGGDPGYQLHGMVNVPVIDDVLAVRAVGWREEHGGFIDHFAGVGGALRFEDANDAEITGGRIALKWYPSERLTLSAYGLVQESEVDDVQAFGPQAGGMTAPVMVRQGPLAGTVVPASGGPIGDLLITKPVREPWDDLIEMFGATIEYDTGVGTLLATASLYNRDIFSPFDTTPTVLSFGLVGFAGGVSANQFQESTIVSTEVRFSSDFDGPLNFVAGVFYERDDNFTTLDVLISDPSNGRPPCQRRAECLGDPALVSSLLFARTFENDIDFFRVFAHADWEIDRHWTIGAGVAYFEGDLRTVAFTQQGIFQPFAPPALGGPPQPAPIPGVDEEAGASEVTFDANLAFERTDNELYFFRAASGFRPGGINDSALAQTFGIDLPQSFEPDTVLSYEVGAKTSWREDRLRVNAAYFKMFWDDIHVPGQSPIGNFEFVSNAAEAEIDGVELELVARPSEPWTLTFAAAWLDARLTKDQSFPEGFPAVALQPRGFAGDNIPRVPEWSLSGTAEYHLPYRLLAGVNTVIRAGFSYVSESETFFNETDDTNTDIGDYFLLDVSASMVYGNWELRVFVNNVTDDLARIDVDNSIDGFDVFTVRPRHFGAQVSWKWE